MENIKTKSITETAIITGIIVLMSILGSYIPFLLILVMIVLPILTAIIYYRNGLKYSLISTIISLILNCIIIDFISSITIALCCGIVGLTLGYCISSGKKGTRTLLLLFIAFITFYLADMWIMGILIGIYNPIKLIINQASELSSIFMNIIEEAKVSAEALGAVASDVEVFEYLKMMFSKEMLIAIMPSTLIFMSFIQSYICFAIFEYYMKRINKKYIGKLDLSEVYISNLLGAALIAALSICIILINKGVGGVDVIYTFIMTITKLVLCINGICAIEYYLKRKVGVPKFPRLIIIVVTFVLSSGLIYSFIGFGEMLLDFRKLDPHRLRKA